MGKRIKAGIIAALLVLGPVVAQNGGSTTLPPLLLITEVMTGSLSDASAEFVELYNPSHQLIDNQQTTLKLQYLSATGTNWLTKTTLVGELQPRGHYLIATDDLVENADIFTGLGLAASGGHLRLLLVSDSIESVLDELAWGDAAQPQQLAAPAPDKGQSLKRRLNEDGHFIDTNNDFEDFSISLAPSPERAEPIELDEPLPDLSGGSGNHTSGGTTPNAGSPAAKGKFLKVEITELMIDPDKPLTDADDEFVEIYNPNKTAVDLEDYVIETGAKFSYRFALPNISLKAGQYLAVYSIDSNLVLSNSTGAARLLDPAGNVVFETPTYTDAKPNITWANISGQWQWTGSPTPGAANQLLPTGPESAGASTGANGLSQGSVFAAGADGRNEYEDPAETEAAMNTTVVAGVGSMALLYAGYEYRYDIGNRFHQLRRYLESRRQARPKS
ncbi:MAG TPA: lamin tail domain-containing protein [Candidatus Saccharimonadales bacterium]